MRAALRRVQMQSARTPIREAQAVSGFCRTILLHRFPRGVPSPSPRYLRDPPECRPWVGNARGRHCCCPGQTTTLSDCKFGTIASLDVTSWYRPVYRSSCGKGRSCARHSPRSTAPDQAGATSAPWPTGGIILGVWRTAPRGEASPPLRTLRQSSRWGGSAVYLFKLHSTAGRFGRNEY